MEPHPLIRHDFPGKINFSQIFSIPLLLSRFSESRPPMVKSRPAPPGNGGPEEKPRRKAYPINGNDNVDCG